MGRVPSVAEAYQILKQYNQEAFHLRHGKIVSGVMGYFAREYDPAREDYWKVVGMLHDIDFELYPQEHCLKAPELLREHDIGDDIIHSVVSHGFGLTVDVAPEHIMEKILYAVDELTGLIGAVAIMRPSKSVSDLGVKSVMKKYKTASFAAGCSREVINRGAEMLGMDIRDLVEQTILAMRSLMDEMEI